MDGGAGRRGEASERAVLSKDFSLSMKTTHIALGEGGAASVFHSVHQQHEKGRKSRGVVRASLQRAQKRGGKEGEGKKL